MLLYVHRNEVAYSGRERLVITNSNSTLFVLVLAIVTKHVALCPQKQGGIFRTGASGYY